MPKVDLYEFESLGVILSHPTGIIYTNQVAGYACLHPEIEGAFVPLVDGVGRPAIHALTQRFRGGWESLTIDDADVIDGVLRSAHLGFITTDRKRLTDSYEAWVYVDVDESAIKPPESLLSGFGAQKGGAHVAK
jgi:hypothetical protein